MSTSSLPFQKQIGVSIPSSAGVGGLNDQSSQGPINYSPSSQRSEFSNHGGLDAIDLNDDAAEDRKQESIHWRWEEDELPISAWLNVSMDHLVGTDQKGDTFWKRIHAYCQENNADIKRGEGGVKKRWHKINTVVQGFGGCHDQASRNVRSGSNSDDILEMAHKLYSTKYGKKFTFERHWNMLRREQKWRTQSTQSGGSKRTKLSVSGTYSSSSNPETPISEDVHVESPIRPQGSKKSKRKGKGKAKMSKGIDEDCLNTLRSCSIQKLEFIEDYRMVKEKELEEREKERQMEIEYKERLIAIKEKELRDFMEIKMAEIKSKEREMDMQILHADTSTMSEKQRALHEIAVEKIIAKWS